MPKFYEISKDGQTIHVGGVYLTYSGDEFAQYCFAKVVLVKDDQCCVKLFHDSYVEFPKNFIQSEWTILPMSLNMFLAWGAPILPILYFDEIITDIERSVAENEFEKMTDLAI